jgi:ABC-type phosphate/phosphonate transport system substrate-binding protein
MSRRTGTWRKWSRIPAALAAVWLGWGLLAPMVRSQTAPPVRRSRLNVLASRSIVGAINPGDAQAAGTIWVQAIGRRRGFQLESRFEVAPSLDAMQKRIEEFSVDLIVVDAFEYLKIAHLGLVKPFVAIARGRTGITQNFHLVVNRDSGYAGIADLRGKKVLTYSRSEVDLGRIWAETQLNERRLGRAESFLGSIGSADKPSSACLPVFFAKMDACVLNGTAWDTLTEMNPQLASRLQIIATSPPYLEGLLCLHVRHTEFVDELLQGLLELNRDPEGRQLLMVFKGDRADPVKDQDLAGVRRLWTSYMSFAAVPSSSATASGIEALKRK